jgi:hypothetical protein
LEVIDIRERKPERGEKRETDAEPEFSHLREYIRQKHIVADGERKIDEYTGQ